MSRPATRRSNRLPHEDSDRPPNWVAEQALALGLTVLGALMLLGLLVQPGAGAGWLIEKLAGCLRVSFGVGSYVVATAAILAGLAMLMRVSLVESGRGLAALGVLFLLFLGALGLQAPTGDEFVSAVAGGGGGALGAVIAWGLRRVVGEWGAYLVLGAAALFALSLAVERPLIEHLQALGRAAHAGSDRVTAYLEKVREQRRLAESAARTGVREVVARPRKAAVKRAEGPKEPEPAATTETAALAEAKPVLDPGKQTALPGLREGERQWQLPPLELLSASEDEGAGEAAAREVDENARRIEETLEAFGIPAKVVACERGPSVSRYELEPARGIRVSRVVNLADDLAMALAAPDVRVEAPIPGRSAIGIEVPNRKVALVTLRSVMESQEFQNRRSALRFALGKDVAGHPVVGDLTRMPHLLIGGATNSGKSVSLNCLIVSLLYSGTPEELRLILIDPKRVELTVFEEIPHLFCPIVHDAKDAAFALREAIKEMRRRYRLFSPMGVKNIGEYNEVAPARGKGRLPYIVVVVDELADLMMQGQGEFERLICRLAQLARATGIHLVVATQRPSVNVITGTIKANIASRIGFAVASQVDSRTILDCNGAERLIGSGDMLYSPLDASRPVRVQGSYVTTRELQDVVRFLTEQGKPEFVIEPPPEDEGEEEETGEAEGEESIDEYWKPALEFVRGRKSISVSLLQRKLRIGYNRSARLIELMEERGIVGAADGSKPREVLLDSGLVESPWEEEEEPEVEEVTDEEEEEEDPEAG